VPVIGSIFGFSVREFVSVATTMEDYGVDAIELNLSCPNVGKAGAFFGTSEELTYEVVKAVKDSVNVPVIAKLPANTGDLVAIAKACERAECDAVTAINTLKAMKIDLKAKMPILGHKIGGLSGPCIKPIGVASVYEIVEDAVEYLMAGASAVQIGVGVADRGISIFKKVSREIEGFMVENSYKSLKDLIGIAQG
jgi:dihydroorotate dehydrogenase (NAD+) catalytic subunit